MGRWWWRTVRGRDVERTETQERDAAWLLALWWVLHGGTVGTDQPAVVTGELAEAVAAEVIAALAGTFDAPTRRMVVRALPARAAGRSGPRATEVSLAQLRTTLQRLQVELSASPDPGAAPIHPRWSIALFAPREYCFRFPDQTVYITLRPPALPPGG
jgi:hypothetical protein